MINRLFIISLIVSVFPGCLSGVGERQKNLPENSLPIDLFQKKAVFYEEKDELQSALASWRIAENLIIEKISTLTERIENNAEKHFQKGLTLYNAGFFDLARPEFVKTLAYDRKHKEALKYLRIEKGAVNSRIYRIKEHDTFAAIAGKVYKNSEMSYLVKYFSDCENSEDLKSGETIILPELETEFTKCFFNLKKELCLARKEFAAKAYENVLIHAENILLNAPRHNEALYMKNTACFRLGEKYFQDEKYQQAMNLLKRVDRAYRNVKGNIAEIKTAFTKKRNETLAYETDRLYHEGLELYEKKQYLESLDIFSRIEPEYANVAEITARIKTEMKTAAEFHYKNGVKYFVNEDLELALEEWEKALRLDPGNGKIEKDIENAMNLLEKIEKIN